MIKDIPQLLNDIDKDIRKKFEEFLKLAQESKKLQESEIKDIYHNFMKMGELWHLMGPERDAIRKYYPHLNKLFDEIYTFYFNELWSNYVQENRKNHENDI